MAQKRMKLDPRQGTRRTAHHLCGLLSAIALEYSLWSVLFAGDVLLSEKKHEIMNFAGKRCSCHAMLHVDDIIPVPRIRISQRDSMRISYVLRDFCFSSEIVSMR